MDAPRPGAGPPQVWDAEWQGFHQGSGTRSRRAQRPRGGLPLALPFLSRQSDNTFRGCQLPYLLPLLFSARTLLPLLLHPPAFWLGRAVVGSRCSPHLLPESKTLRRPSQWEGGEGALPAFPKFSSAPLFDPVLFKKPTDRESRDSPDAGEGLEFHPAISSNRNLLSIYYVAGTGETVVNGESLLSWRHRL